MTFAELPTACAKYMGVIKLCAGLSRCFIIQFRCIYVHVLKAVFCTERALCSCDERPKYIIYKKYQTWHCHGCDCEDRQLLIRDAVSFATNMPAFLTNLLSPSWGQRSLFFCDSFCLFAATFFFKVVQTVVLESSWHRGTKRSSGSELRHLPSSSAEVENTRRLVVHVANPDDRAFQGVGLKPFNRWNRGFELHWRRGSSSLVFIVCCVGSGLWAELLTRSGECYRVGMSNCAWSRNLKIEAVWARVGSLRQSQKKTPCIVSNMARWYRDVACIWSLCHYVMS